MSYAEFLASKRIVDEPTGLDVDRAELGQHLYPFQRDIVEWALRRGRAALFADCGLGKTPMQLEWARVVHERTGRDVLLLAPLAVSAQTAREGEKFGVPVTVCRDGADVRRGVNVTNYERLERFRAEDFGGLVLDESSILKAFDGATRRAIIAFGRHVPFRLACTATPAPNELIELGNHAEFLAVMGMKEMQALFFTQDGNSTSKWRLKGHAEVEFWRWMASWCATVRRPSDLGYPDDGFELPPLEVRQLTVGAEEFDGSQLFGVEARSLMERRQARRDSLAERVERCAGLVNADDEQWLVWCDLNAESEALTARIPGAVEIRGSDTAQRKERAMLGFSSGEVRVLVTKPAIAGFGMNWQHCARMAFVGLSDSYEQFYQAVRRCWRFGQERPVVAHVITAETEGAVVRNIERKEWQAAEMADQIVHHMAGLSLGRASRDVQEHERDARTGHNWTMHLGDCVEAIHAVSDESVGLTVFSPPFPGMYAYTNSPRDMGNVQSNGEMIEQFSFLAPELLAA